ncbi:MAG TPA: hypothetical protein VHF25_06980 [Nitriliruptorales bacterium]|nr:hypothetical protein [Nitriliruptorales bacterium]
MREASDLALTVKLVDGEHTVRLGGVTGSDARLFRAQVGVSLLEAITSGSIDLDVVAGVVWLSRRKAGERSLPYQKVADELSWDTVEQVEAFNASERNGDPPTTASTSEASS